MTKPIIPATCYSGATINPRTEDWSQAAVKKLWLERTIAAGRGPTIANTFYKFNAPFPSWTELWHKSMGRIPMVSWNGGPSDQIVAGDHDVLIRKRARSLRDLNTPVFLRYFWEMDGHKKSIAQSPEAFIKQWERIYYIFVSEGADNVAFVWCPNAWAWDIWAAEQWYPGDQYVDWIAADGYNWYPKRVNNHSLGRVYSKFYSWASSRDKPLMIGEYGAMEDPNEPYAKAHWLFDARMTLQTAMPKIKAAVYFDVNKDENGVMHDWRVDSSKPSYMAYADFLRDPYFV